MSSRMYLSILYVRIRMCVCVRVCACLSVYFFLSSFVYLFLGVFLYVFLSLCMLVFLVIICLSVCIYVFLHVCVHHCTLFCILLIWPEWLRRTVPFDPYTGILVKQIHTPVVLVEPFNSTKLKSRCPFIDRWVIQTIHPRTNPQSWPRRNHQPTKGKANRSFPPTCTSPISSRPSLFPHFSSYLPRSTNVKRRTKGRKLPPKESIHSFIDTVSCTTVQNAKYLQSTLQNILHVGWMDILQHTHPPTKLPAYPNYAPP